MIDMASQITSLTIVYSTVYSGADQRKHQSSTSLAFVRGIHRPVTRKMFPFDDVIMLSMIPPSFIFDKVLPTKDSKELEICGNVMILG